MAEIFGAVGTAIALANLAKKTAVKAHQLWDGAQDCDKRMQNIALEIDTIEAILRKLEKARQTPAKAAAFSIQEDEKTFRSAMKGLGGVLQELCEHMESYEKQIGMSRRRKVWNATVWSATGHTDALELLGMLESHRSSLNVVLSLQQADSQAEQTRALQGIEAMMQRLVNEKGLDPRVKPLIGMLSVASTPALPQGVFDNTPTPRSTPRFESFSPQFNQAAVDRNAYYNVPTPLTTPKPTSYSPQPFTANSSSGPPAGYKARPGSSISGTTIAQDDEPLVGLGIGHLKPRDPDDPTVFVDGKEHRNSLNFVIALHEAPKEKRDDLPKRHPEYTTGQEAHYARLALAEQAKRLEQLNQSPRVEMSEWPSPRVVAKSEGPPIYGIPMEAETDRGGFFKRMFSRDTRT